MPNTSSAYTKIATVLWLGGAFLFATALTMGLHFPARAESFLFILIVGLAILVRLNLNLSVPETVKGSKAYSQVKDNQHVPEKTIDLSEPEDSPIHAVSSLKESENTTKLTGDQARQWLDDFLVKQQAQNKDK